MDCRIKIFHHQKYILFMHINRPLEMQLYHIICVEVYVEHNIHHDANIDISKHIICIPNVFVISVCVILFFTFLDAYLPVKHYGLEDNQYSLLYVEERTYQDNTYHDLIVLSSPYDNTEIRHCWDSLEIKQLRAIQEGVFLEFCPHCCSSATMVQQGFTLRLPQKDVNASLEFFCEHTSAKFKPDQTYICEMMTHSILCTHSPPVRPAPNPPPVPAGMNLTLYNVSDVLFGYQLTHHLQDRLLHQRQEHPNSV